MNGATFYEYIANIFHPWLQKNNIKTPVVLFVAGHRSHLASTLSDIYWENQIILRALYPNSTHILQPMDASMFHPLKTQWKKKVRNWKIENNGARFNKEYFCPTLKKALNNIPKETLTNGFQSCSFSSLNSDNIR
ncbi:DDE superfamily endonuclease [Popillia japonica]|uniref:DDE superfamily endonuclease n=1 Tax=Popillia japonica TaxID=7064 RepID=A0AAW1IU41_POPJA